MEVIARVPVSLQHRFQGVGGLDRRAEAGARMKSGAVRAKNNGSLLAYQNLTPLFSGVKTIF